MRSQVCDDGNWPEVQQQGLLCGVLSDSVLFYVVRQAMTWHLSHTFLVCLPSIT